MTNYKSLLKELVNVSQPMISHNVSLEKHFEFQKLFQQKVKECESALSEPEIEETLYRKVSVKERLPKKYNNATFSEWVGTFSDDIMLGEAVYDYEDTCWQFHNGSIAGAITHWLEEHTSCKSPASNLSGEAAFEKWQSSFKQKGAFPSYREIFDSIQEFMAGLSSQPKEIIIPTVREVYNNMEEFGSNYKSAVFEAIEETLKQIKELNKFSQPKEGDGWVKCSDRMPYDVNKLKYNQTVAVIGFTKEKRVLEVEFTKNGMFRFCTDTGYKPVEVTHWQNLPSSPLPEPSK